MIDVVLWIGGLAALAVVGSSALSRGLRRRADPRLVRRLDALPASGRIVVLGCRPRLASGAPNRFLVDRIAAAAAAHHLRPDLRLLCTGLDDEVVAMREGLQAAGVVRERIDLDDGSGRTIESIDFVASRHADETLIFVTQPFHMPRTLFLARSAGLDAWGLVAAGTSAGRRARLRERLAEARAVFDRLAG